MSQILSAKIIGTQIKRLDTAHDEMVKWAERLSKIYYSPKIYDCYIAYHLLLSNWSNSLISMKSALPNVPLPIQTSNELSPTQPPNTFTEVLTKISSSESFLAKLVILGLPNIPLYFLVAMRIIPWLVAVIWSVLGVVLIFSPQLLDWYAHLSEKKEEEFAPSEEKSPEWISREIQVMSDKYDAIRALIKVQNVDKNQLPQKYRKMDAALFSREQQEREFFPTECLNIIRKIMIFCNAEYYGWSMILNSYLKSTGQVPQLPISAGA